MLWLNRESRRRCLLALTGASVRLAVSTALVALTLQAQPSLRITSPADGTIVRPGELIDVTVAASETFQKMVIVGTGDIGLSDVVSAPPWKFAIRVPSDISPGKYTLLADGITEPGKSTVSESVTVDVELGDATSLDVTPFTFELIGAGDKSHVQVDGIFPAGLRANLSRSTQTSFKSSAPDIATVSPAGVVTAVSPGSAKISVSYRTLTVEIPITVLRRP